MQEDGVAVAQLELHIAQRRLRSGALHHPAVLVDVHVVGGQIAGALGQDFATRDAHGHGPGRVGHDRGEGLFQAGSLVFVGADDDAVGMNRLAVLPVDHDGGGGVDLDPLGIQVALQPAAAFQVQGDLTSPILGRGAERALGAGADAAVRAQTVARLEAAHRLLQF
ncbi:hypothetical protein D3C80_1512950 [compost metagenome]